MFIITFWAEGSLRAAIPCVLLGGAIGWIAASGTWCVALSLAIGYYLSTTHANPLGLLTAQAIDFPPVLFATLLGFALIRWLRSNAPLRRSGLPPLTSK